MLDDIRSILSDALQLGIRAGNFTDDTPLLGSVPELDSMAVVTVLMGLEERFDMKIEDDEINAEIFETVGTLRQFVEQKVRA